MLTPKEVTFRKNVEIYYVGLFSWHLQLKSTAKGQTILKANYGFLNSPKKQTKLTILSKEDAQDSYSFRSFWEELRKP